MISGEMFRPIVVLRSLAVRIYYGSCFDHGIISLTCSLYLPIANDHRIQLPPFVIHHNLSKSSAPMSPSCCSFVVFVGVWWLPLMLVVAEEQQGGDCSAQKCGNVNISDPVWLTNKVTGRSCGSDPYSDFDVACINNSYPALRSSIPLNNGFRILNISYEERSFYAVDLGKLDVLNAPDKCRAVFYNTSVKLNRPFKIAPVNLNLILYNCTEEAAAGARRNTELAQTRVRCWNEWEVFVRAGVPYDATGNYTGYALEGCTAVVVPVPGSSAGANASDYEQLFNDGFLLTWDPALQPSILPPKFTRQIIF